MHFDKGHTHMWDKPVTRPYAPPKRVSTPPGAGPLSPREVEVLKALAEHGSKTAAARVLFLSEHTVKSHAVRIYRKLGVGTAAQAVAWGFRAGVLS